MRLSEELAAGVLNGNRRALARAATLAENDPAAAIGLLRAVYPASMRARVIGVTGAPGAGKSTLTAGLIRALRAQGRRAGVVAVDPSSPFSGGALLGDRIRMGAFVDDEGVFIRSMASRGQLGGLAAATGDLVTLIAAAGFDPVIVETVGAGQDEVEIAALAHCTCVVLAPGQGDGVQALKAGILEIADVFALNKSDLPGAAELEQDMRAALQLAPPRDGWTPPLVRCAATRGEGLDELLAACERFLAAPAAAARRERQWALRLRRMFAARAAALVPAAAVQSAARRAAGGEADPYTILEDWLARLAAGRPIGE